MSAEIFGELININGFHFQGQRAVRALPDSEEAFRAMIDVLPAAIYTTDANGKITHFNPACIEFAGRTPQLGSDYWCVSWKLFYPDGRPMPHDQCPMAIALKERRAIRGAEGIAERPDGTRVCFMPHPTPLFDDAGELIGGINMLVDITERKAAEARIHSDADALTKLNQLSSRLWNMHSLRAGLDEMLAATMELLGADFGNIQILDARRGVLLIEAQQGFQKEFLDYFREVSAKDGSACGRALGSGERIVVEDVEADLDFAPMIQILRNAGFRAVQSTPIIARDGRPLGMISTHFRSVHRPSENDFRRFDLYVRQAADFIEHQRDVEDLRQAREAAETANRIKDEFLATVSHELRTPLNSIMGWTHLLTRGNLGEEASARALETIARNAAAQSKLISDLLDVSRIMSGKLRCESGAVDLVLAVEAATDTVRPAADAKEIALQLDLDRDVGLVLGDGVRLQQIISNLLINAIKFSPRGEHVTVRLNREGTNVLLTVSDNGEGISPEFLPYVFDRFRQAENNPRRQHGGMGLGLAIVRYLVEAHGGTISASSKGVGKGATFVVMLPLLAVPSECRTDRESASFSETPGASSEILEGLRVLVVDDNEDVRELSNVALTQAGAEVRTADTARAALELLKDWKPNILVADIGMPGEDGYDLIRAVRELELDTGETIPALALTGYASAIDVGRVRAAGYHTHMAKPVSPRDLVLAVANLANEAVLRANAASQP
jgi:PAS domain S-box-containing protein